MGQEGRGAIGRGLMAGRQRDKGWGRMVEGQGGDRRRRGRQEGKRRDRASGSILC